MIFLKTKNISKIVLLVLSTLFFFQCSKDTTEEVAKEAEEVVEEVTVEEEVKDTVPRLDASKIISINTSDVAGELYNFWSTRPMINLDRFNATGFRNSVEQIKDYVKNYNIVRPMGGRLDGKNNYYRGVDESGNIITDFRGLITSLRNFTKTGLKPRIVLDNVPWEMSVLPRTRDTYGNSKPPKDYDLWTQYVSAYAKTLVDEFGMEEVKTWRFRVGTEPNLVPGHWRGTMNQYFKHYDFTVDALVKVIPDAIVGPGNSLTEGVATFTTEIIDHCATGRNFVTGATGTRMSFFAISYYEKIDQNAIKFPEVVGIYRRKLDSYPQFRNIPFDIQEFGVLRDENRVRGLSLSDATDLGASWYATIADMAYESRLSEIYDWGQEVESSSLPAGRKNVMYMFQMMENGMRLRASKPKSVNNKTSFGGAIPVLKNGKIYMLVYNHNTSRITTGGKTFYTQLEGSLINNGTAWKMNQWTVDRNNGVFMHELYKDLRAAGVQEKTNGRIYGNRPSDRFDNAWKNVLNANIKKYEEISKLPQTITDSIVSKEDGKLTLKIDFASHAVKLIELTPQ